MGVTLFVEGAERTTWSLKPPTPSGLNDVTEWDEIDFLTHFSARSTALQ